jgi:hypothetical protein
MRLKVPVSLAKEHQELHAELVRATKAGGRSGVAAQAVAALLHPHFAKEEEFALPPLDLLGDLAAGKLTPAMHDAIALSDRLKRELPRMIKEHKGIVRALEKLASAAKREKKSKIVRSADKLVLHAKTEEQVLYPAAILVGEYLRLILQRHMPE